MWNVERKLSPSHEDGGQHPEIEIGDHGAFAELVVLTYIHTVRDGSTTTGSTPPLRGQLTGVRPTTASSSALSVQVRDVSGAFRERLLLSTSEQESLVSRLSPSELTSFATTSAARCELPTTTPPFQLTTTSTASTIQQHASGTLPGALQAAYNATGVNRSGSIVSFEEQDIVATIILPSPPTFVVMGGGADETEEGATSTIIPAPPKVFHIYRKAFVALLVGRVQNQPANSAAVGALSVGVETPQKPVDTTAQHTSHFTSITIQFDPIEVERKDGGGVSTTPGGEGPLCFDDVPDLPETPSPLEEFKVHKVIGDVLGLYLAPSTDSLAHSISVKRTPSSWESGLGTHHHHHHSPHQLQISHEVPSHHLLFSAPTLLHPPAVAPLDVVDFGDINVNTFAYKEILLYHHNPLRHHRNNNQGQSTRQKSVESFTNSSLVAVSPYSPFTPAGFPTKEFLMGSSSVGSSLATSLVLDEPSILQSNNSNNTVTEVVIGNANHSDYIRGSLKMYLVTTSTPVVPLPTAAQVSLMGMTPMASQEPMMLGSTPAQTITSSSSPPLSEVKEEAVHYGDIIRIPHNVTARLRIIYHPKKHAASDQNHLTGPSSLTTKSSKATAAARANKRRKEGGLITGTPLGDEATLDLSPDERSGKKAAAEAKSKVWGERVIGGDRTKFTILLLTRSVELSADTPYPTHATLSRSFHLLSNSSQLTTDGSATMAADLSGRRKEALPFFPFLGNAKSSYQAYALPCRAYVHVPHVRIKPNHDIVSFGQCYVSQSGSTHLILQNLAGTDAELALDLQSKAITVTSAEAFPLGDDHSSVKAVSVPTLVSLRVAEGDATISPTPQTTTAKPNQIPLGIPVPLLNLSEVNHLFSSLLRGQTPAAHSDLSGGGGSSTTHLLLPARSEVLIKLTIVPQRVNPSYMKQLTVSNLSALSDERNPATFRAPSQDKFPNSLNLAHLLLNHPDANSGPVSTLVQRVLTKDLVSAVLMVAAAMSKGFLPPISASPWWRLFSPISGVTNTSHQRIVVTITSNNKESQDTRLHDTLYRCERRGIAYAEVGEGGMADQQPSGVGGASGVGGGAKSGMLSRKGSLSNLAAMAAYTPERPSSGDSRVGRTSSRHKGRKSDSGAPTITPQRHNKHVDPHRNATNAANFCYPNTYKQPKVVCHFPYAGESFRIKNRSSDKDLQVTISTTSSDVTLMCLKGCLAASLVESRPTLPTTASTEAIPQGGLASDVVGDNTISDIALENTSFDALLGARMLSKGNSSTALDEHGFHSAASSPSALAGHHRHSYEPNPISAITPVNSGAATPVTESPVPHRHDDNGSMVSPTGSWSRRERSASFFRGGSPLPTDEAPIPASSSQSPTPKRTVKVAVVKGSNADQSVINARNKIDELCGIMALVMNVDSPAQPVHQGDAATKDSRGGSEGGQSTQGGISSSMNDPQNDQHLSEDSTDLHSDDDSPHPSSDSHTSESSSSCEEEEDDEEGESDEGEGNAPRGDRNVDTMDDDEDAMHGHPSRGASFTSRDSGDTKSHDSGRRPPRKSSSGIRANNSRASSKQQKLPSVPPSAPQSNIRQLDDQTGLPLHLNPPTISRLLEVKKELLSAVQSSLVSILDFISESTAAHLPSQQSPPDIPPPAFIHPHAASHVTFTIPPRESFIFYAVIKRSASASRWTTKEDSIAIHINGVEQPQLLRLSYQICESGFEVAHKSKSFGDVLKGDTKTMSVKVENPYASPVWYFVERQDDAALNAVKVEGTSLSTRGARYWGYLKPHSSRDIEVSASFPFLDKFEQVLRLRNVLVDTNVAEMTIKAMVKKGDLFDVAPDNLTLAVAISSKVNRNATGAKITLTNTSKQKREICCRLGGGISDLDGFLSTQSLLAVLGGGLRSRLQDRIGTEATQPLITQMSMELTDVGKKGTASKSMEERIETLERKLKIVVRKGKTEKIVLVRAQLNKLKAALNGVAEGDVSAGMSDFGGDSDSAVSDSSCANDPSGDEGEGGGRGSRAPRDNKLLFNEQRLAEVFSPKGGGISLPVLNPTEGLTINVAVQVRFGFMPQSRDDRRLVHDVLAEWRAANTQSDTSTPTESSISSKKGGGSDGDEDEVKKVAICEKNATFVFTEVRDAESKREVAVCVKWFAVEEEPMPADEPTPPTSTSTSATPHSGSFTSTSQIPLPGARLLARVPMTSSLLTSTSPGSLPPLPRSPTVDGEVFPVKKPSTVGSSAPVASTSKVSSVDAVFLMADGSIKFESRPSTGPLLVRFPHTLPLIDPASGAYFNPETTHHINKVTIRLIASSTPVTVLMLPNDAVRISNHDSAPGGAASSKNAKFKCSPSSVLVTSDQHGQVSLEVLPRSVGTQKYRIPIKNLNNPADVAHIEVEFTATLNNGALRVSWDGYEGSLHSGEVPPLQFPRMVAPCRVNSVPIRTFTIHSLFPTCITPIKGASSRRYLKLSTNQPQHFILSTSSDFSSVVNESDILSFPTSSSTPITLYAAFLPEAMEVMPPQRANIKTPSWGIACGVSIQLLDVPSEEGKIVESTALHGLLATVQFEARLDISYGLLNVESSSFTSITTPSGATTTDTRDTSRDGTTTISRRHVDLGLVSVGEVGFATTTPSAGDIPAFKDGSGTKSTTFVVNNLSDTEHVSFAISTESLLTTPHAEVSGPSDVSIFVVRDGEWKLHKTTIKEKQGPLGKFTLGRREEPIVPQVSQLSLFPGESLNVRIAITPKASGYFAQLVVFNNLTSAQGDIEIEMFGVRYEGALVSSEKRLRIATPRLPIVDMAKPILIPTSPSENNTAGGTFSTVDTDFFTAAASRGDDDGGGYPCPVYYSSSDASFHLVRVYSVVTLLENKSSMEVRVGMRCSDLPLMSEVSSQPFTVDAAAPTVSPNPDVPQDQQQNRHFGQLSLQPKEKKYVRLSLIGVPQLNVNGPQHRQLDALEEVSVHGKVYFDAIEADQLSVKDRVKKFFSSNMLLKKGHVALVLDIHTSFAVSEGTVSPAVVDVGKVGALGRGGPTATGSSSTISPTDKRRLNITITNSSNIMPLEVHRVPQQCVKLGGFRMLSSSGVTGQDETSAALVELPKEGKPLRIPPGAAVLIEATVTMEKEVSQGPFSREQCFVNHNNNENTLSVHIKGRYYASIWRVRFNDQDLKVLKHERESINLGALRVDVKGRNQISVDAMSIFPQLNNSALGQQLSAPLSVSVLTDNRFSLACYEGRGIAASVTCKQSEALGGLVAIQLTTRDTVEPLQKQLLFNDESTSIKMRLRSLVISPASSATATKGGPSWLSRLTSAFYGSKKAVVVGQKASYQPCRIFLSSDVQTSVPQGILVPSSSLLTMSFVEGFDLVLGGGGATTSKGAQPGGGRDSWMGALHIKEDHLDREDVLEEVPVYGNLQPFQTFQVDAASVASSISEMVPESSGANSSAIPKSDTVPTTSSIPSVPPISRIELRPLGLYPIKMEGLLGDDESSMEEQVGVKYEAAFTVTNVAVAHAVALELQCLLHAEVRSSFESEFLSENSDEDQRLVPAFEMSYIRISILTPKSQAVTSDINTPTSALSPTEVVGDPSFLPSDVSTTTPSGSFPTTGRILLESGSAVGGTVTVSMEIGMSKMLEEELLRTVDEDKSNNESLFRVLLTDTNVTQPSGQRLLPVVLYRRFSFDEICDFITKENDTRRRHRRKSFMSEVGSAPPSPQAGPQDLLATADAGLNDDDEDDGVDGIQVRGKGSDQPWLSLVEPLVGLEEGTSLSLCSTEVPGGPDGLEFRDGDSNFTLDVTSVLSSTATELAPFHVILRNLRGIGVKFDIRIVSTSPKRWLKLQMEEIQRPAAAALDGTPGGAHPQRRTVTISEPSENKIRPHGDLKVKCVPLCTDVGTFEADLMISNVSDPSEAIFLKIHLHVFSGGQVVGVVTPVSDPLPVPVLPVTETLVDNINSTTATTTISPLLTLSGAKIASGMESREGSHVPSPTVMSVSSEPTSFLHDQDTPMEWGRSASAATTPSAFHSNPPVTETTRPLPQEPHVPVPQTTGITPQRVRSVPVAVYCPSRGGGGMTASDEFGVTPLDLRTFVGPFTLESRYFEIHNKASNALEFTVRSPGAVGAARLPVSTTTSQAPSTFSPTDTTPPTTAVPPSSLSPNEPHMHIYPEDYNALIGGTACIVSPGQEEATITIPAQSKRTVQLFIAVTDVLLASGSKAEVTVDIVITSKMLRNTAFIVRVTYRVMPPSFAVVPSGLLLDLQPKEGITEDNDGDESTSPFLKTNTLTWHRHMNPNDEALARMSGHLLELELENVEHKQTLHQEVRVQNLANGPCQYVVMTDARLFYVHAPVLAIPGMGVGSLPLSANMSELRKCMQELEDAVYGPTAKIINVNGSAVFLFEERVYVYHRYEPRERQTIFLNIRVSRPGPNPSSTSAPQLYYSYHRHLKKRLEARVFTVIRLFLTLFGNHRDKLLEEIDRLDRGAQLSGLQHLYAGGLKRYLVKNHSVRGRNVGQNPSASDPLAPLLSDSPAATYSAPAAPPPAPMRFSTTAPAESSSTHFNTSSEEEVLMMGICFISSDLVHMINHEGKVRCCHPLVQQTLSSCSTTTSSITTANLLDEKGYTPPSTLTLLPSVDEPSRYLASWVLLIRMLTACIEHNDVIETFISKDLWGCPEAPAPLLKHIAISLEKLKEALFHCEQAGK